jgi:ribonucleoside-triphosphate reductase
MQNVTINLPRIAYLADGDDAKLYELLEDRINLAARAHVLKKDFITKLLKMGKNGPLSLLAMDQDGEPYYRLYRASFLLGMLGLNEMVQYHTGQQLHESNDALKMGLRAIAHMHKYAKEVGERYDIHMPLEQTPAESTAYRMAKLDMKYFPLQTPLVLKGYKDSGEIYYTNSTYLNVSEPIDSISRVKKEGLFHNLRISW